jgi:hypothetical protein
MKEINDKALEEKRDLTAEEQQEYDRLESGSTSSPPDRAQEKLEGLGGQKMTPARSGRRVVGDRRRRARSPRRLDENLEAANPQDDPEYRWAFYRWMTVRDSRELPASCASCRRRPPAPA